MSEFPERNVVEPSTQFNNSIRLVRRPAGPALFVVSALLVGAIVLFNVVGDTPQAVNPTAGHPIVPAANTHLKDSEYHMVDSFRVVDMHQEHVKSYERNSYFHDDKGRRLLASHSNAQDNCTLQEFTGSINCQATGSSTVKTLALSAGKWEPIGMWTSAINAKHNTIINRYIFLMLGNKDDCKIAKNIDQALVSAKSCVLLDYRYKAFKAKATAALNQADAMAAPMPAYEDTYSTAWMASNFPKLIGQPGDCFQKCSTVVWFMLSKGQQAGNSDRMFFTCKWAEALGCKVPGAPAEVGYMPSPESPEYDASKPWRSCSCQTAKQDNVCQTGRRRRYYMKEGVWLNQASDAGK